jgi:hypothetical protein
MLPAGFEPPILAGERPQTHALDRAACGIGTPRPLYHRESDPVPIVQEAGWAPGPVWTGAENLAPSGIRSPDRPSRSEYNVNKKTNGMRQSPEFECDYVNTYELTSLRRIVNQLQPTVLGASDVHTLGQIRNYRMCGLLLDINMPKYSRSCAELSTTPWQTYGGVEACLRKIYIGTTCRWVVKL